MHIHRTRCSSLPAPETRTLHEFAGGPEALLQWLESQLGLPTQVGRVERIQACLQVLQECELELCGASLTVDPWATAAELLDRRDELHRAGWVGQGDPRVPLIQDLAALDASLGPDLPGEAQRVAAVERALNAGQALPEHEIILDERPQEWPPCWRPLLERLTTDLASAPDPLARSGCSLRSAQDAVQERAEVSGYPQDDSLRWLTTASVTLACRAIAGMLASDAGSLERTVIHCEDNDVALILDQSLREAGLPTLGVASGAPTQPALQLLPLVLELCWEPVDPQLLLDFLNLPVCPIPRRATWALVDALAREPGLGSHAWERARTKLCSEAEDSEGRLRPTLELWFDHPRYARSEGLPIDLVIERCRTVAHWCQRRAASATAEAAESADWTMPELAQTFRAAALQAEALAEHVSGLAGPVAEPQLARLLEAHQDHAHHRPQPELAGRARFVESLSEIHEPCDQLIWLGVGTRDPIACRWTRREREFLEQHGAQIDDGRTRLEHMRAAERRGFQMVRDHVLVVQLPIDDERRPHPIWTRVRALLKKVRGNPDEPVLLERHIAAGEVRRPELRPWRVPTASVDVVPRADNPEVWDVDPALIVDREASSASELNDRLGCPLKWTLGYQARLYPGDVGRLPGSFLLRGNFSHAILEAVFSEADPLPTPDEAAERVAVLYDQRLPLDAAPLAQPASASESSRLRQELIATARVLVEALDRGNYRIVGMEKAFESHLHGRRLRGSIDCLVVGPDDVESVIDFKYGGAVKYRELLEQGKATQLATYAGARHRQSEVPTFPAVAYLIISTADLYTPDGGPLAGSTAQEQVPAPAIEEVWHRFQDALAGAEEWIETGQVPVRPRQDPMAWTSGCSLVLDPELEIQSVCLYCDYTKLCGLQEVK